MLSIHAADQNGALPDNMWGVPTDHHLPQDPRWVSLVEDFMDIIITKRLPLRAHKERQRISIGSRWP